MVIEDSGIGNRAAKGAGMACLVTTSTYTTEEDFAGADRIVPELASAGVGLPELRALLGGGQAAESVPSSSANNGCYPFC